jgi:hypothetical protein
MNRSGINVLCAAALFLSSPASGVENYSFEIILESPDFPGLDAEPVLDGEEGEEILFTAHLAISTADPIYLIQYLLLGGKPVPPPFPHCGRQPGRTELACPEESVAFCP